MRDWWPDIITSLDRAGVGGVNDVCIGIGNDVRASWVTRSLSGMLAGYNDEPATGVS